MIRALLCLLAAAAFVRAQEPAPRFVQLTYRETVETTATEGQQGAAPTPRTESTFVVTLGPDRLAVQRGERATVWLFDEELRRVVDLEAATYTQVSTLARASFVQQELQNRRKQREVLAAGNVDEPSFAPFELSVLFGWYAYDDRFELTRSERDGQVRYQQGDELVTAWRLADEQLTEAQRRMFTRLLQRLAHVHPKLQKELADGGRAPRELVFRWLDVARRSEATWTLERAERLDSFPFDTQGMRRVFRDDALGRIEALVHTPDAEGRPQRLTGKQFLERAEAAAGAGSYRDAMLLFVEFGLSTGESTPDVARRLLSSEEARKQLRATGEAIGAVNSKPAKALELLAALDRADYSRPAMLGVFRANALRGLGRVDEAIDVFLEVLKESPFLVAAWADLGKYYVDRYRMEDAWRAWDLGRHVDAQHGCWRMPAAWERRLRAEFREML